MCQDCAEYDRLYKLPPTTAGVWGSWAGYLNRTQPSLCLCGFERLTAEVQDGVLTVKLFSSPTSTAGGAATNIWSGGPVNSWSNLPITLTEQYNDLGCIFPSITVSATRGPCDEYYPCERQSTCSDCLLDFTTPPIGVWAKLVGFADVACPNCDDNILSGYNYPNFPDGDNWRIVFQAGWPYGPCTYHANPPRRCGQYFRAVCGGADLWIGFGRTYVDGNPLCQVTAQLSYGCGGFITPIGPGWSEGHTWLLQQPEPISFPVQVPYSGLILPDGKPQQCDGSQSYLVIDYW